MQMFDLHDIEMIKNKEQIIVNILFHFKLGYIIEAFLYASKD